MKKIAFFLIAVVLTVIVVVLRQNSTRFYKCQMGWGL